MAIKLEDVVAVVQKEIRDLRAKYKSVTNENGQDHPIMVEDETTAGYFCQLMVNSQEVAKIFCRLRLCALSCSRRRCAGRYVGRFRSKVWVKVCLLGGSMKARQKRHKSPKCGKYYVGYPALLREDNKTEICPECGIKEALFIFAANS